MCHEKECRCQLTRGDLIYPKPRDTTTNGYWLIRLTDLEQLSFELQYKRSKSLIILEKTARFVRNTAFPGVYEHLPCAECSFFCTLPERIKRFFDKQMPLRVIVWCFRVWLMHRSRLFSPTTKREIRAAYLSDIFAPGFALQHRSRDFLSFIKHRKIKNGGELLEIVVAAKNACIVGFEASLCPRKGVNHGA